MNLADSASLQIGAEDRLILCGVPLYPAMAASAECLIYYENKFLIVDDRKRRSIRKRFGGQKKMIMLLIYAGTKIGNV